MKFRIAALILLTVLCINQTCLAQDEGQPFSGLKKHAIHFTPGVQALTLSYERKLWHPKKQSLIFKTITARFEVGGFDTAFPFDASDRLEPFYGLSVSGITGTGNNHLEVGVGLVHARDADKIFQIVHNYLDLYPSLGYRFQKPDGKFVFRAGVSNPRITYISVGYAF